MTVDITIEDIQETIDKCIDMISALCVIHGINTKDHRIRFPRYSDFFNRKLDEWEDFIRREVEFSLKFEGITKINIVSQMEVTLKYLQGLSKLRLQKLLLENEYEHFSENLKISI